MSFEQRGEQIYDLVIVAEVIGSTTSNQVFGNEVQRRALNLYTAYFSEP